MFNQGLQSTKVWQESARAVSSRSPGWGIEQWLPVAAICGFCLLTSANPGYAENGGGEVYHTNITSNPIRQASFLALAAMAMYLLLGFRSALVRPTLAWTILLPVLAAASFLGLSVFWSDLPGTTVKRGLTVLIVVLTGIAIGRVWSTRDLVWGVLWFSSLFLAASVAVELNYRAFLDATEYRFSGLIHPIRQSFNCTCILLSSIILYTTDRKRIFLVLAAVAILCLLMTKARTGVVAALLAVAWLLWNLPSLRSWLFALWVATGVLMVSFLLYQAATGHETDLAKVATMGRDAEQADPTKLTGRWEIWQYVLNDLANRPLLGFGYGAYWTEARWDAFERATGWPLYHSHSSYLETALGIGAIGLILVCQVLLLAFHRSYVLVRQGDPYALLVGGLVIMAMVGGFSDVSYLQVEYESLLLMTAIGVMIFAQPPQIGSLS
jgi:exopolysaccharide production protein ExoQ